MNEKKLYRKFRYQLSNWFLNIRELVGIVGELRKHGATEGIDYIVKKSYKKGFAVYTRGEQNNELPDSLKTRSCFF